jgi:hypothetical protein
MVERWSNDGQTMVKRRSNGGPIGSRLARGVCRFGHVRPLLTTWDVFSAPSAASRRRRIRRPSRRIFKPSRRFTTSPTPFASAFRPPALFAPARRNTRGGARQGVAEPAAAEPAAAEPAAAEPAAAEPAAAEPAAAELAASARGGAGRPPPRPPGGARGSLGPHRGAREFRLSGGLPNLIDHFLTTAPTSLYPLDPHFGAAWTTLGPLPQPHPARGRAAIGAISPPFTRSRPPLSTASGRLRLLFFFFFGTPARPPWRPHLVRRRRARVRRSQAQQPAATHAHRV